MEIRPVKKSQTGSVQVEQIVLVGTVAIGFATAVVGLGSLLLSYHQAIEFVLVLPIP